MEEELLPLEVLYGFVALLTSMDHPITVSASHGVQPLFDIMLRFADNHNLREMRPDWYEYLNYPEINDLFEPEEVFDPDKLPF